MPLSIGLATGDFKLLDPRLTAAGQQTNSIAQPPLHCSPAVTTDRPHNSAMPPADDIDQDPHPERPSKSRCKRDMHRLQELGERLAALDPRLLPGLPLGETLQAALEELRHIRSREAHRRQLQYIGRLMRAEDGEAIAAALERLASGSAAQKRLLHRVEQWRELLLERGDAALGELVAEHPRADVQVLRQLLRSAQKERAQASPPVAGRRLFRALRALMAPE
jgi:ribosome-associated protein